MKRAMIEIFLISIKIYGNKHSIKNLVTIPFYKQKHLFS